MVHSRHVHRQAGHGPSELPLLAALVRDAPLGLLVVDTFGRFLFANAAAVRWTGAPAHTELVGRLVSEVLPGLWEQAEPVLGRALRGEVVEWDLSGEALIRTGLPRPCAQQWFPVHGPDGSVAAVAATILDTNDLIRARMEAEGTASVLERLIHLTSHELRGPLTNVLGYSQRALRREASEEVRQDMRIVRDQAFQIRDRLDLFVALSDLEELEIGALEVESVDLGSLIAPEVSLLREAHPGMRIEVLTAGNVVIRSDPRLVREVIQKLLDNAAKYSGASGEIIVRVAPTLSGAVVEVHDDGPGVGRDEQARLFEPGFRTSEARESGLAGEGLGLYVANTLSRGLGGALSVVSDVGEGTSFFLQLPRMPGQSADLNSRALSPQ